MKIDTAYADIVNGKIVQGSLKIGNSSQGVNVPPETFAAIQNVVESMYRAGLEQVPAFRKHAGKRQILSLIRETPKEDRQVTALSGSQPHRSVDRLEQGQERLFVRISFDIGQ